MTKDNLNKKMLVDINDVAHSNSHSESITVSHEDWKIIQHEITSYIAVMSAEMSNMARTAKLDILVYFLNMVAVEANAQIESSYTTQQ